MLRRPAAYVTSPRRLPSLGPLPGCGLGSILSLRIGGTRCPSSSSSSHPSSDAMPPRSAPSGAKGQPEASSSASAAFTQSGKGQEGASGGKRDAPGTDGTTAAAAEPGRVGGNSSAERFVMDNIYHPSAGHLKVERRTDDDQYAFARALQRGERQPLPWEYAPSPEHRSLVLMLYRCVLKDLIEFKSIRRKSLLQWTRLAFRRRAMATEKLLIDECIEEARRSVYVLAKHKTFETTQNYDFDAMYLPKDTGQDVKSYMEKIYDPAASKSAYQNIADVQPGMEDLVMTNKNAMSGGRAGAGGMPGMPGMPSGGGGGLSANQATREEMEQQFERERTHREGTIRPPPPGDGLQR